MKNTALHLFAIAVAVSGLYLEVTGAMVTGALAAGQGVAIEGVFSQGGHRIAAEAFTVLVLGLAIWLTAAKERGLVQRLGWIAFAGVAAEAGLGMISGPAAAGASMAHAFLAPLALALVVAIAVATSGSWQREAEEIPDKGWPSLRGLARNTLVLVVIQIALGAAFRYGSLGVMWHILGAMVVTILILTLCVLVTQVPEQAALKPAAVTLTVIIFVQVFLGLTVVSIGAQNSTNLPVMALGATHVAMGAVTLAASVVLGLEIRRRVRAKT